MFPRIFLHTVSWCLCILSISTRVVFAADVLTNHNNLARTGAVLDETALTTSNVNVNSFGKLFTRVVNDEIYSQILYVSDVNIPGGGTHNVIYVATVSNTVYAFDADYPDESVPLWVRNCTFPGGAPGTTNDLSAGGACGGNYHDFSGNIGIVGTPVIDRTPFPGAGPDDQGTIYFVTRTKLDGIYLQHLHALDIRDGSERPNSPVQIAASIAGTGADSGGGVLTFNSYTQNQRPGLALVDGIVYVGWSSFCDLAPYHGWLIGYDATTLQQKIVYNDTPDGANAGIWMGGQAPAADESGNIYLMTGNGTMGSGDDPQNTRNRGMSMMKLTPGGGTTLTVASFFTPYNYASLEAGDVDFGSTGPLLIPDTTPALAVGAGKQGRMYVVKRDNMGGYNPGGANDNQIVQSIDIKLNNKIMGSPVYWKGPGGAQRIYIWGANDNLKAFTFNSSTGMFNLPPATSTMTASNPGAMLSLSANGSAAGTGIVWAMCPTADANQQVVPGYFRAFNAENPSQELWNSRQNAARDDFGNYAKFNPPTVANGRVYLATFSHQLCVYGLITPPIIPTAPSGLQALAASKTQVHLMWSDNSFNEAGFHIERAEGGGDFRFLNSVPAGTTTFEDMTVDPFMTYSYRVRAYTINGSSDFSNIATTITDVGPPEPEIDLRGNGVSILSGSATASAADGTDFGSMILPDQTAVTMTFEIRNLGNAPLVLGGAPLVQIGGPGAASFQLVSLPPSSVPASGSGTFQIRFSPSTLGPQKATVTIASNDSTENPYTFAIQGIASLSNLSAWWKFNATSGAIATDSSGNGNTGTLTAPQPVWTADGHFDGALAFNGAQGQAVTVPSSNFLNPTAAISLTAWIDPSQWGDSQNRRIAQKGSSDNQYRLTVEGNVLKWDVHNVGVVSTATLPPLGTWTHVAGTYDGSQLRLFINGVQVASTAATGSIPVTSDPLQIATKNPDSVSGDHFSGLLDDIRIYGRALSSSEIMSLAAQAGAVSVVATDGVAQKATSNTGLFTFRRTGPTADDLLVPFSLATGAGQAIYRTDYGLTPLPPNITIPAGQSTAQLIVTPIYLNDPTGTLAVTVSVDESSGYAVADAGTATVQILDSPVNQWKITQFGSLSAAKSALADDSVDADNDGEVNLLEFSLGHSALVPYDGAQPGVQIETISGAQYLTYTFVRPHPAPAGITYIVEMKTDLNGMDWMSTVLVPGYPIDLGNGQETMKFRSIHPYTSVPAEFIRLRITRP